MDANIIHLRRAEIEQEIARYRNKLEQLEAELGDLDVAERVMARLTGAKRNPAGAVNESRSAASFGGRTAKKPTMPQMITHILQTDSLYGAGGGLAPKDVTAEISQKWGAHRGEQISAIMWRMWKRGQLVKGDGAVYSLPKMKSASGVYPGKDSPEAGLFNHPAQGREAGPGGGT